MNLKTSSIVQLESAFACLKGIKSADPKAFTPQDLARLSTVGAGLQNLIVESMGAVAAPIIKSKLRSKQRRTVFTGIQPDRPPSIEVDTDEPSFGV